MHCTSAGRPVIRRSEAGIQITGINDFGQAMMFDGSTPEIVTTTDLSCAQDGAQAEIRIGPRGSPKHIKIDSRATPALPGAQTNTACKVAGH
jgi:hypothetical protein